MEVPSQMGYTVDSRTVSILDNLKYEKSRVADRLKEVEEAIEILEKNPELNKLFNVLKNAIRF